MNEPRSTWWESHQFALAAVLVAAVAIAASVSGLWNQYAYDDLPVIFNNPMVTELQSVRTYFTSSYWGPTGVYDALYRPLAVMAYAMQWAIGDGAAWVFHATNIALYAIVAVTLVALLRQLVSPGAALLGAALFAAHPLHVEAVANVVGQAELWVGAAVLGALALYARARRRGLLDLRSAVVIVAAYIVSLFVKEHGIVLPALIVLLELVGRVTTFARQPDDWRRMRLLVLVLGLAAALYLVVRVQLLGTLTGDEPHWGIKFLSGGERAAVMLALVPEFARLFLWPARLYSDYSPPHTPVEPVLGAAHLPGALILIALLTLAVLARRREPLVPFALAWLGVTMLAISNLLFPIGVLLAERTLFLPSVAVAVVAGGLADRVYSWRGPARSAMAAVAGMLIVLGVAHSAARSRVWEDNPTLFSTLAIEAPNNFRAPFALAEFYMLGNRPEVADTLFRRSLMLWPEHVPARLVYTSFLQQQGRCPEALPIFRQTIVDDPTSATALVGTVVCLLDAQRFEEARRLSVIGTASGFGSPLLRQLRQVAESVLVAMDTLDARNRWWREGKPFERTGRRLDVNVNRMDPLQRTEQRRAPPLGRSARPDPEQPEAGVP